MQKENKKNSQSPTKTTPKSSPMKRSSPSPPPNIMNGLSNDDSEGPVLDVAPSETHIREREEVAPVEAKEEEEHEPPAAPPSRPKTSGGRKPMKAKRNPELSREDSEGPPPDVQPQVWHS